VVNKSIKEIYIRKLLDNASIQVVEEKGCWILYLEWKDTAYYRESLWYSCGYNCDIFLCTKVVVLAPNTKIGSLK